MKQFVQVILFIFQKHARESAGSGKNETIYTELILFIFQRHARGKIVG